MVSVLYVFFIIKGTRATSQFLDFIIHHRMTERQTGFRANHNIVSVLFEVTEWKLKLLVILDHSKAFDIVDYSFL